MERLNHVLGGKLVEHWLEFGSLSDNKDPWYLTDLSTYDTPEKRREIVDSEYNRGSRQTGSVMVMLHKNYTLAFMERTADSIEYDMATKIQTWARGWLARNAFWSPYTEIGRARLNNIYSRL